MSQELIFILKTLQSTVISRCYLIDYNCGEIGCDKCPISTTNIKWYGYKLIQLGNL